MSRLKHFFELEAAGGIVLLVAAVVALVIANAPLDGVSAVLHDHRLHFAVNDGLMAIFFFMVGLEIKREMVQGALSSRARAILPVVTAIAGMVVPALVFVLINHDMPGNMAGWAIPAATDIAFAVCVITLAGSRVPPELKILLLAVAVIDDLGAILIIAMFYGGGFQPVAMVAAAVVMAALAALRWRKVDRVWPYIVLSGLLWVAVLQSGVHATLAGVMAAMFVPLHFNLDKKIHAAVVFGILPLFGLLNTGVPFSGMSLSSFGDPLTLGIIMGLVVGKPVGIFIALALMIRLGLSPMPSNTRWGQLFGMACLCGIGFTMSLFIGGLAFSGMEQQAEIRLGVLGGSVIAALLGYIILRFGPAGHRGVKI